MRGVKAPLIFGGSMAIIGSNSKPLMIKGKKTGKILGDTGSWYRPENKNKYNDNYDAIFGKKENETKSKAQ
jgi:hypothetical protein